MWFAKFQYVIAVAIVWEKKNGGKIKSWARVFRALNTDFINDYMRPCYGRKWRDYSPKTFVLVILFAQLFDYKVNDLLDFLRKDQCWRRIICGSDPVPRPSDISNFKRRVGEKRLIYCFQALTGQIMGCMDFEEIDDNFVLKHFANLIAGCLERDKKKNGYETIDFIKTFLATNVLGVFEDESGDEITEEHYREMVEFRSELRAYAETMNCLFSVGTMGMGYYLFFR